ncbi:hypothetical protein F5Y04DRAFT_275211 [Hypomontagnella monticulosa]|nr:hypothetical protein F5Y04DRAFT_275211 [Hypomontagnella monticulosa]
MLSRKGSERTEDSGTKGMSAAAAEFTADLDKASKEAVDEMKLYEEEFLRKIEKEVGYMMESVRNR